MKATTPKWCRSLRKTPFWWIRFFGTFEGKAAIGEFMKKMNAEMGAQQTSFVVREIDGGGDVAWAQWTAKTPAGEIEGCGLYRVRDGLMTYYKDYMNAPASG